MMMMMTMTIDQTMPPLPILLMRARSRICELVIGPIEDLDAITPGERDELEIFRLEVKQLRQQLKTYTDELPAPDRPPDLEEMWADINGVIATIARQFTDRSCVALHYDELHSQGLEKLSKLISNGILTRMKTRREFFAFFRTAVNNHIRGQVQRHRFTIKRTGIPPLPKELRDKSEEVIHTLADEYLKFSKPEMKGEFDKLTSDKKSLVKSLERWRSRHDGPGTESTKPVEISLNDDDAHLQVGESEVTDETQARQIVNDMSVILTPLEFLVFNQMREANNTAYLLAEIDSYRGKPADKTPDPVVRQSHAAEGLGLDEATYRATMERVKGKVLRYMQDEQTAEDTTFNLAVANLERTFTVQVPKHIEAVVIRRLFTLLARRHLEKVNHSDEIKGWLAAVGAKIPEPRGHTMPCFGVLYQKGNKICEHCTVKGPCSVEAANFGLGEITLHPEVLGSRQVRVPTLAGVTPPSSSPVEEIIHDESDVATKERDDEICNHLTLHFSPVTTNRNGKPETLFKLKTPAKSAVIVFGLKRNPPSGMSLRFCVPKSKVKEQLESVKNGYYLPRTMTASDAIKLIDEHAGAHFK